MSNFHERIAQLPPEKRALLAERLFQKKTVASQAPAIPKRKLFSPCPASFAQQRLWFLDRLDPGNTAYNMPSAFRIHGPLHIQALEKAFKEIVRRHETLRTSFIVLDGGPVQEIAPSTQFAVSVTDLQEISEPDRDAEARRRMNNEAEYSFDLSRGPLFRATLLTVGPEDHLLLLVMHHIISDAWSIGVLFQELSELYTAFLSETPSSLPDLPIQYADFALWQREWLQGEVLERQLTYWKTQLASVPEGLNLPTDHPRPAVQSLHGSYQSCLLPVSLTKQLNTLSHQQNMTMFITLLSAFYVFLFRYTGQDDILVGTPIANRSRRECESLIGFFLNTLVLRADLSGNPTFRDLLQRVKELCLAAYAHQDLPLDRLIEELQPERDLARHPLFQVLFVYQPAAVHALELPEVIVKPFRLSRQTAKFDLTLFLRETPEGLRASIEYSTDLFEVTTISHMLTHFQTLLQEMAGHPEQRLSAFPMLTNTERHQLIVEWNATRTVYPDPDFIDLFETQVKRTPHTVAVACEDQQLTYRTLNMKANQLAHYLQDKGAGPDVCVGICVERSLAMAIGVLGILKTGGAYVPLDPDYPEERLAFMLSDSHILILLTQTAYVEKFFDFSGTMIDLDHDWVDIAQQHDENPDHEITLDNLAYVIYTSGSTGIPKGVAMPRRTLSNLIFWQCEHTITAGKVSTLQFASLSFDVSFQELFSTWGSGGTLVLISEDLRRDPIALLRFLELQEIHRLFLPFVALQQLAEVAESSGLFPKSLREVVTAGEQLQTTPALMGLFTNLRSGMLINQYGPSESHVVTAFSLPTELNSWAALPPIGKPIANIRVYILDQSLNLVPTGVNGEVYLGGVCLARGYLNRPDLTAERFIPDPFSNVSGARLYKTGDQARYLADGNIEFLGRLDHQVKIRGFRIELGEVEAMLHQHPAVQDTMVLASEDAVHNKRLIAYVISTRQSPPTSSELRRFLQQKLPEYMIPAVFVFLETFPLTPSGKVDRLALPAPGQDRPTLENTFVAPQNAMETQLVQIWETLLGTHPIGITDRFFDLGGHSLLAVRLLSKVEDTFDRKIPLLTFFQTPTIKCLAELLHQDNSSEKKVEETPSDTYKRSDSPRHARPFSSHRPGTSRIDSHVRRTRRHHKLKWVLYGKMSRVMARTLPYGVGTRLVSWFCRQPWAQKRFYQSEIRLVKQVLVHLPPSRPENEIIHHFLITYPWSRWRVETLANCTPQQFSQWVTVNGGSLLQQSSRKGKGVILVGYHFVLMSLVGQALRRSGFTDITGVGGVYSNLRRKLASGQWKESNLEVSRVPLLSAQLYRSKESLDQGGIMYISADAELGGSEGITLPFHGRWREFKIGFAELALMTGADVLPVSASLKRTGQVHVTFLAPLDKGDPEMNHQDRVKMLVRQYANFLEERWTEDLGNIRVPQLKKYLALPMVEPNE